MFAMHEQLQQEPLIVLCDQDFYRLSLEQTLRSTGKIEHLRINAKEIENTGQIIGQIYYPI